MEEAQHDVEAEDISLDISTVNDNPHLPAAQMKAIHGIKDEELRDVYLKGNWTKLTGLVFPLFEVVDSMPTWPNPRMKRYYAIDFGWEHPFVLLEFRQIGMDVYIDELVYESKYDYENLKGLPIFDMRGVADSQDPRSIKALQVMGLRVKGIKKPKIVESVRKVRTHNLFITRRSENTIKEIKTYKRKRTPDGQILEEVEPGADHAMDCVRYGIQHFSRKSIINIL